MAEGSGSSSLMGVIIGAILVVAVGFGIFAMTGGNFGGGNDVQVELPDVQAPSPG